MHFIKVIILIPILWLSISKIDKVCFYLNYFKSLETLSQKNQSSFSCGFKKKSEHKISKSITKLKPKNVITACILTNHYYPQPPFVLLLKTPFVNSFNLVYHNINKNVIWVNAPPFV